KEKDVLIKEVHHRVKNNLQIVSSLLHLQAHQVPDAALKEQFTQSINRIRSMALIHEMLYRTKSFNKINMGVYLNRLVESLWESGVAKDKISKITAEVRNIKIDIDKAIPCGLIMNELISNAIKYAFPGKKSGYIKTVLKRDYSGSGHKYLLIIKDNGVGIPERIDIRSTETLGLQLIHTLTEQLEGSITQTGKKGTCFEIRFG
ncbi:MAG: sensor histidine kinase, partial [Flavobacteriales bacterium]